MSGGSAPLPPDHTVVRVVIADPHPTVRRALRATLASEPGFVVIDAVAGLAAAGAAVRRHRADALVVDARLLESDPHALGPIPTRTAVVGVGMDDHPGVAAHVCRRGAVAYVLKDEAHIRLPAVLRDLCQAEARTAAACVAPPPWRAGTVA
jgi:DNA-binding NarL/FixJ family response regulator